MDQAEAGGDLLMRGSGTAALQLVFNEIENPLLSFSRRFHILLK